MHAMELIAFNPGLWGPTEIILILLVLVLLFGARRLPELARSIGRSLSEFRKGRMEGDMEKNDPAKEPPEPTEKQP